VPLELLSESARLSVIVLCRTLTLPDRKTPPALTRAELPLIVLLVIVLAPEPASEMPPLPPAEFPEIVLESIVTAEWKL
jgi:hypothetical protein